MREEMGRPAKTAKTAAADGIVVLAARELLSEGPNAVTIAAVAAKVGQSERRIYDYAGAGGAKALLNKAIVAEIDHLLAQLEITTDKPVTHITLTLIPDHYHLAPAWALRLAGKELRRAVALAINVALGEVMGPFKAIGFGIVGVMEFGLEMQPGVEEFRNQLYGMTYGVRREVRKGDPPKFGGSWQNQKR